jgi:hypothetical protein
MCTASATEVSKDAVVAMVIHNIRIPHAFKFDSLRCSVVPVKKTLSGGDC